MPGENYGLGYLEATGAAQAQDIAAAKAPVELQHMRALTRLNQATAAGEELSRQMQLNGLSALQGFQFDKANPTGSYLEMISRLAGTNPVAAEKMIPMASQAMLRQEQTEAAAARTQQVKQAVAIKSIQAMYDNYQGVSSSKDPAISLARMGLTADLKAIGASDEQVAQAIHEVENTIDTKGAHAIEFLHKKGMTQAQIAKENEDKAREAREAARDGRLAAYKAQEIELEKQRVEQARLRLVADGKVDGATGQAIVQPPKGGPRPRIDMLSQRKVAAAAVENDPILGGADYAMKTKWAGEVLQTAINAVDASYAAKQRNQNLSIKDMKDAIREAVEDKKKTVKQDPTAMQEIKARLHIDTGPPVGKTTEKQSKELPADLSNFEPEKDVIYTRGGKRYQYDEGRHGLVKVE